MSTQHKTDVEDRLDSIEPQSADARQASRMRRIIAATEALDAARSELNGAVCAARAARR